MKEHKHSVLGLPALVTSMVIWGTIGIFRRYIPLPSGVIALARGVIGALFLAVFMLICKKRPDFSALRRRWMPLLVSGVFLGANWILFFESYNTAMEGYATVATATVCYYMAPVIVMLLAPLVLKERLTLKKALCILVAFVGVILVSNPGRGSGSQLQGILLALAAAVLYAVIVLLNKKMADVPALDRTVAQLAISAVVLLPYTFLAEPWEQITMTPTVAIFLILIGLLHTGVAYALYFGSIGQLKAQTAALCSYIDPALAILLSATVLQERVGPLALVGAVMVIGAALVGELELHRKSE